MGNEIFFSIIIPTRNRPALFNRALQSVLEQDYTDIEIIVINDGSDDIYLENYKEIINAHSHPIQYHSLVQRKSGHGQSYSMNYGVSKANGKYLCFLDDDDEWTDAQHLSTAYSLIKKSPYDIDLYYTNQEAYHSNGKKETKNIWLEDLVTTRKTEYVEPNFLLKSKGFAHLNCSIFKKSFYIAIGGMDENIRYECDRDIYLRSLDKADNIIYNPSFISRHHIPNASQSVNMSTAVNYLEKKLYQIVVYEKGILNSYRSSIRNICITGKLYQLKHLSEHFYKLGNSKNALFYAKQALATKYTLKWHLFVFYLKLNSLFYIQ